MVATGSDAVGLRKGDAGEPALRLSGSSYQVAGLHHVANQAQCLGEAAGDPRGTETRLDDMRGWVFGNLTGFDTGSKLGDLSPTWTNTEDDNGGVANVRGICCGLTGPELLVNSEQDMAGGERALMHSGYDNSTTESYAYMKAYDMGQSARAGRARANRRMVARLWSRRSSSRVRRCTSGTPNAVEPIVLRGRSTVP